MRTAFITAIALLALLHAAPPAAAEDLSTEQIIEMLRPPANARSISRTKGIEVDASSVDEETSPTVNLYVNFSYKSAELQQDARITLDRLAVALKDNRLADWDFLIGGHTDAVGGDSYNVDLSERRALAVRNYLITAHGISGDRLIDKGFGESRLLDRRNPNDGVNRRVQITTLAIPGQ
jgi:outer membrane protein OmpA-like peptidoglycan-associated protein